MHELLHQVQQVLAPSRELDLATLERTFTLRWHDSLVALSGPALLAAVRGQAPGVRLRFVAESSIDTPESRRGKVGLEANSNRPSAPDIRAENVGETRLPVALPSAPVYLSWHQRYDTDHAHALAARTGANRAGPVRSVVVGAVAASPIRPRSTRPPRRST